VKPATTPVVTMAWLRSIAGLEDIVAADLPEVAKWVNTGFVTVGPNVGGSTVIGGSGAIGGEIYAPIRHGVVQIDCWAAFANSKKINHGRASELAALVWEAGFTDPDAAPAITLPSNVKPVHLLPVYPVSPDVRGPIPDPNNYAHYQIDVHIGWIHQGAIPGVVG
jgi:hypothetical protein